jgi:hypothetical protein
LVSTQLISGTIQIGGKDARIMRRPQ